MARDTGKPPFAFTNILTEPLVEGLPGAGKRLERRKSFVTRFLRRSLRRLTDHSGTGSSAVGAEALAKAAKMWRTAAHAFETGRVDSAIRYVGSLRRAVEARVAQIGEDADRDDIEIMTRRAWADAKPELDARLTAIDSRIIETDPASDEDNYYWMKTHAQPEARTWDGEAITLLATEIREVYHRIVAARANLKFLALYVDDLRWLADWGATPAEALTAVPANRVIKQKLKKVDTNKAYLNEHVSRVLGSPIGRAVRQNLHEQR
jgi:hypothetical protein